MIHSTTVNVTDVGTDEIPLVFSPSLSTTLKKTKLVCRSEATTLEVTAKHLSLPVSKIYIRMTNFTPPDLL